MTYDTIGRAALCAVALLWACGDGDSGDADPTQDDDGFEVDAMEADEETCSVLIGGHCITDTIEDECGLDTGYDGDIMCLKAPDPDEGFQLHIGPTEYTAEGMADFILEPGVEDVRCLYEITPNDTGKTYYESLVHMRPVSHHLITTIVAPEAMPADYDGSWTGCGQSVFDAQSSLPGSQSVRKQTPTDGVYPPEYTNVGYYVLPNRIVRHELHFLNTTDGDLLREAWTNVYYKPQEEVEEYINPVAAFGSTRLVTQPGTHVVNKNQLAVNGSFKAVSLYGHYHAHTTRFSIWRERAGERLLVYEDFDWFDPTTFAYNSITENPEPDRALLNPGASTGVLEFEEGDVVHWECEVLNDSEVPLPYRNEALTGEMCNVFGESVGPGRIGRSLRDDSPGIEVPVEQ